MTMFGRVLRDANTEFKTAVARVRAKLRQGSTATMRRMRSLDLAQLEERLLLSVAPPGNAALLPTGNDGSGGEGALQTQQQTSAVPTGPANSGLHSLLAGSYGSSRDRSLQGDTPSLGDGRTDDSGPQLAAQRHELVFIDASLQNHAELVADLEASQGDRVQRQVVLLESDR